MTDTAKWYRDEVRRAKLWGVPRDDRTLIRCELIADLLEAGHLRLAELAPSMQGSAGFLETEFDALADARRGRQPNLVREQIADAVAAYCRHAICDGPDDYDSVAASTLSLDDAYADEHHVPPEVQTTPYRRTFTRP